MPGELAGVDLSSVNETSDSRLDDLTQVAQDRVKQGIQADSRPDAVRLLDELTSNQASNPNLKPVCSTRSAAPSPTTPVEPSVQPGAGATSGPGRTTAASAPPTAPVTTPDAPPSDPAPPVIDPVGCRPVD